MRRRIFGAAAVGLAVAGAAPLLIWKQSDFHPNRLLAANHSNTPVAEVEIRCLVLLTAAAVAGVRYLAPRETKKLLEIDWASSHQEWVRVLTAAADLPPELYAEYANQDVNLALYHLGRLSELGRYDEAIAHFQDALNTAPDFADAEYSLGEALAKRGQTEEAVAHFRKALALNARFADAEFNLGRVLAERGQLDEAAHLQKAAEIRPDDGNFRRTLQAMRSEREKAQRHEAGTPLRESPASPTEKSVRP
jgi:tetratricopeptide (TPR) repeat protein